MDTADLATQRCGRVNVGRQARRRGAKAEVVYGRPTLLRSVCLYGVVGVLVLVAESGVGFSAVQWSAAVVMGVSSAVVRCVGGSCGNARHRSTNQI